jgi:hypothetical protein
MASFLKPIKEKDLILNKSDTRAILTVFLPQRALDIKNMDINNNHRALAQGLLVEGADSSKKLEVMKAIAEFAYTHNPIKVIKILDIVKKAAEVIYEYKQPTDISIKLIDNSELSQEAINKIRLNFGREINMVIDGFGSTYIQSSIKDNSQKTKLGYSLESLEQAKQMMVEQQQTNQKSV